MVLLHGGFGFAGQCAGGGVALPAAAATAGTLDAVLDDDGMPHLTGGEVEAAQNFAVQNDAAADAGTQRDDNGILVALGTAGNVLAVGGGVGVVFDIDLAAQQLFHIGTEVPVVIAEVGVKADKAGVEIDAARRADAHIGYVGERDFILACDSAAQVCQCLFQVGSGARQAGRPGDFAHDIVVFVHKTGGHGGAAQINTDGVLAHNTIPPISSAQARPCVFSSLMRFCAVALTTSACGNCTSSSRALKERVLFCSWGTLWASLFTAMRQPYLAQASSSRRILGMPSRRTLAELPFSSTTLRFWAKTLTTVS